MNLCCKVWEHFNHCPTCGTKFIEDKPQLPDEIAPTATGIFNAIKVYDGEIFIDAVDAINELIRYLKAREK